MDSYLLNICREIVHCLTDKQPLSFHAAFLARKQEAVEAGNKQLEQLMGLLGGVFSMYFRFGAKEPFGPLAEFPDGTRTMLPEDITEEELAWLKQVVEASNEPVFVARICDVLWIRCRRPEHARKAIRAYLECAERDMDESWVPKRDYVKRATQLAMQLGRKAPERAEVKDKLESLFEASKDKSFDPSRGFWPAALAEILIENRLSDDWKRLGDECARIAAGFPLTPGCDEPRKYYQLAAKCYDLGGLHERSCQARLAIAKHWEAEANTFATSGGEGLIIAHRLEKAIEAYRGVGGQQEKVEELLRELKEANRLALGQMKKIEVPLDVQPMIKATREMMAGKSGTEALRTFVDLNRPISYEAARTYAVESSKEHPLQSIITSNIMVPEGNVAARVPGILTDEETALLGAIVHYYNMGQDLAGATALEEARLLIANGEDNSWKIRVAELLQNHPIVPENRRDIFERAILAGFEGDKLVFVHLIIPQLENSLREFFNISGLRITSLNAEGVQEERDLNQLLTDENVENVLGKDLLWEMRSSLIEKAGANIRNRLCHGLMRANDFEGPRASYLLWLVLFLLFATQQAKAQPSA